MCAGSVNEAEEPNVSLAMEICEIVRERTVSRNWTTFVMLIDSARVVCSYLTRT